MNSSTCANRVAAVVLAISAIVNYAWCCETNTFIHARVKLFKTELNTTPTTIVVNGCINETLIPDDQFRIDASNQGVTVLRRHAFSDVSAEEILLTYNDMSDIEENAFNELGGVKVLDLRFNVLTHLRKNTVSKMFTLEKLLLQNNRISKVDVGAFRSLQCKELKLDYNELETFEASWFRNNDKLQKLSLSHNRIAALPYRAFAAFDKLDEIQLSHNRLVEIHPEAFHRIHKLSLLDLSSNRLRSLHKDTFRTFNGIAAENPDGRRFGDMQSMHVSFFDAFTGIRSLYLHRNNLTYLPEKLMRDVKHKLLYINIHINPWQCTYYQGLMDWAIENHISINVFDTGCVDRNNPVCVVPSQDDDKCVEEVKEELFDIFTQNYDDSATSSSGDVRCF